MTRRWVLRRVGGAAALFVALYVPMRWADFEPHALPLALIVLVGVAGLGMVVDGLGSLGPSWAVAMVRPAVPPGQDQRFALYLRSVEHHLTADAPDPTLRDRLAVLAALRLEQRHGVTGPGPRRDDLLGPELVAVLDGPVRRLGKNELTRCIQRIEEL